jgi:hypothetical protein
MGILKLLPGNDFALFAIPIKSATDFQMKTLALAGFLRQFCSETLADIGVL